MANKILPFDVVLKEINPIRSFYCPKAYTNDLNSVEFQFTLIDMLEEELIGATANVVLYMRDKSFFQNTSASGVTLEGNVVKYVMKENEGNHAGIAQVQVEIVYTDPIKIFSSKKYNFEIINALETEIAVEVVVQDLTMILSDAAEYIVAAEAAEAIRLQSEIDRAAAENIRLANDIDRPIYHYVTQAEYDALTIEEQNDPKHIYEVTDSDGEVLDELTGFITGMQTQFDNVIAGTTVDSETIDARVDKSNVVHQTLKKRLDNDKSITEQSLFSLSKQLEQKANKKYFREQGTNENAINVVIGSVLNAIAEDLQGSVVSGGGTKTGTENVIGGQWQNVGNNNVSNLPTKTGTNANMSVITGGYDNVNNGLGSFLSGHHNYITENATHSVISGGSGHKFDSGSWAVIAGGQNNTIKGTSANGGVVSGGTNNVLDNSVGATINGGGSQSIINSNFSAINGGFGNKIENAANSIIVGGLNNIANSARSTVFGDSAKTTRTAEIAHANGKNVNTGDCQVTQNVMKRTTTDGVNKANILSITANSTAHFKVSVLAMRTDAVGECKSWEITGLLRNVAGTGHIVGRTILNTYDSTGSLPWEVAIAYEGGGLSVQTKGETAKKINWIIKVEMLELKV